MSSSPRPSSPCLPRGGCRVVLVGGDESLVRAAHGQLETAGFETTCFRTCAQALAHIEATSPAVVVSVHPVPGMEAIAFLARARAVAPRTMRVLCMEPGDARVAVEAVNSAEVCRIVTRPWRFCDLVTAVQQAVDAARRLSLSAQLVEHLGTMNRKLKDLVSRRSQAVLESLFATLDYRDAETLAHSLRVAAFARRLARQLAVCEPAAATLEQAALLHDIGKIGIRDDVLLKPGPLSAAERAEIRRHAQLGWALLQRVDYLNPASLIVLQHHERWDGSGYPNGLRRDQIDLGARIFHVADTLDAMTSDRTYRPARSFAEAAEEINLLWGAQFDPAVADAFGAVGATEWQALRAEAQGRSPLSPVAAPTRRPPASPAVANTGAG